MYVNATLIPPLGSSTVITAGETVRFVAALRVSGGKARAGHHWEVELWYGHSGEEWYAARFESSGLTVHDAANLPGTQNLVYALHMTITEPKPIEYTLRFRQGPESPWIWIKDQSAVQDGLLIVKSPTTSRSVEFGDLFEGTDSKIKVERVKDGVPGTDLFTLTAPLPVLGGEWDELKLGDPLLLKNFYATVRLRASWMVPRQGIAPFDVDHDALMAGYLRSDGRHVVVLCVSGCECTTYINSKDGDVVLRSRNDTKFEGHHCAVVATGEDWQKTVDAAFLAARDITLKDGAAAAETLEDPAPVQPEWWETWYDGLGYCTWNGLGRELSQERIMDALQDLFDNGIYITTLIIDDNWQTLDKHYRWDNFEANTENFPNGLGGLTREIRRRFRHIKHIAVWHSIFGYWEGIAPGGQIDKKYITKVCKWQNGRDILVVDAKDIHRMFEDFYTFLTRNGIDSVKCDVQSSLTQLDDGEDRRVLGRAYQDAFKISSLRHFSGRVIYCMAQQPSIFFHSLLIPRSTRPLLRNSDDFYPDIPSSHPWHIFCNAMNNVFTSHLMCIPDWDMFQSSLEKYGGLHAAGRCISGGPIYITDSPKKHDVALIKQMTALAVRGPARQTILRPAHLSLPTDPYVRYNHNRLLKVTNQLVDGTVCLYSLLAIFNVSEHLENSDIVTLNDFAGLVEGQEYAVRSHATGRVYTGDDILISVNLPTVGWDFFTTVRLKEVPCGSRNVKIAAFGLISSLSGAAALARNVEVEEGQTAAEATVRVKALGVLGIYISDLESRSIDELFITISGRPIPVETVAKSKTDGCVLEVDVEKAWKMMELRPSWSNEVDVTLYITHVDK